MPYDKLSDLPANVRDPLPKHAQEIYLAAFNNAWDEYRDPQKRDQGGSREDVARRVAWSAVKQSYEKTADGWREKR